MCLFFFFKQKTAYEVRISDWSSDVCSSDLETQFAAALGGPIVFGELAFRVSVEKRDADGFTWNPTRRAHENPLDTTQVRAKLLWTRTAVPGFAARFGYTRYDRYSGYSFRDRKSTRLNSSH